MAHPRCPPTCARISIELSQHTGDTLAVGCASPLCHRRFWSLLLRPPPLLLLQAVCEVLPLDYNNTICLVPSPPSSPPRNTSCTCSQASHLTLRALSSSLSARYPRLCMHAAQTGPGHRVPSSPLLCESCDAFRFSPLRHRHPTPSPVTTSLSSLSLSLLRPPPSLPQNKTNKPKKNSPSVAHQPTRKFDTRNPGAP